VFVYKIEDLPSGAPAWSHLSLQPLAPGCLTSFSYSVLGEVLGRAWYQHYDQLGFEPRPGSRVVRRVMGRPYLDISKSAALESTHAGVEPMTLRVNDAVYPVATWKKPGLLGGMRSSRAQRKIQQRLEVLSADADQITDRARNWYIKTLEISWSQAEILQVMEEIERVSLSSFEFYFASRHALEWAYNRLLNLTQEFAPYPDNLALINNTLRDVDGLVENQMAEQMLAMAELVQPDSSTLTWLKQGQFDEWQTALSSKDVADALNAFLEAHGHRSADEGEMRNPRWGEDPTPVLKGILACTKHSAKHSVKVQATQCLEKLVEVTGDKHRKQVSDLVGKIRQAMTLQSQALNATAYIFAGTRQWALAAADEAAADGRLVEPSDIFSFELEEIKQMMTGEWNVSDIETIHATALQRDAAYADECLYRPADVLIGDAQAFPVGNGLPGTAGEATGPLRRWDTLEPHVCNGAIVGVEQLSSGWSIVLPVAKGIITATGTPLDPIVAAARIWHTPIILNLRENYDSLVEGAQTTVDAEHLIVDQ
jgi:hypothetical protein